MEETGLKVLPEKLVWIHEFIEVPFHAIEFYFECSIVGGMLELGNDPELPDHEQMLLDVEFVSADKLPELPVSPEFLKTIFEGESRLPKSVERVVSY